MEEDHPLQKIAVSGPTLASLMHRITASLGDSDGLLFGHVTLLTPSTLSDDSTASSSTPQLVATITSFLSSSAPLSHVAPSSLPLHHHNRHHLLGWFSARRKSPLRPSMREFSFTRSISSSLSFPVQSSSDSCSQTLTFTPSIFLLFTTPVQDHVIHTHEYRAYQFRNLVTSFNVKSVEVVNIGPGFRGHYGAFSVNNSGLKMMNCEVRNAMSEDRNEEEQVDGVEGLLRRLVAPEAAGLGYTAGLEGVYEKMLVKIENLAREVEISDAKVVEQENFNRKLRHRIARGGVE